MFVDYRNSGDGYREVTVQEVQSSLKYQSLFGYYISDTVVHILIAATTEHHENYLEFLKEFKFNNIDKEYFIYDGVVKRRQDILNWDSTMSLTDISN